MKLGSSGQLPGSLVLLAQYSEFSGHLSVGRAGPPGPPLSGEKGPPGRSHGVTDFCSGFLLHFLPLLSPPGQGWLESQSGHTQPCFPGAREKPTSPHPPWAAASLPEALGSAPRGPHSHPHPAAFPGLLGQGILDWLRVCVDGASGRTEGLTGCPPGSCCLAMSDSLRPRGLQHTRLPCLLSSQAVVSSIPGSLSQE